MITPNITGEFKRPHDLATGLNPPLYQVFWEFALLLDLYQKRNPRRVLEIGTFHGGSLMYWLKSTEPGATVVSIDLPVAGASNPELWKQWAQESGQTLYTYQGDSKSTQMISLAHHHRLYDWFFIDGDHSYHGACNDWAEYRDMVAPGGVIVLHDINPREGYGVSHLWREIQQQGFVTQEINAGAPGLCGIGVVYV